MVILLAYIIAHRANGSKYKENTKEAILEVLTYPYVDGIEIDIQMTKDKKFIIEHNTFLLCNNKKIKSIKNSNYKDLKKCKNITLLDEVLKEINTNKIILIDLKVNQDEKIYMNNYIKTINKYNHNIYTMSFNYDFVKKLKKKYPNLKVGYIKGFFLNQEKSKEYLDYEVVYYKNYKNEEGVWTVNKMEDFIKYNKKDILLITDKPEFNE